MAISYVGKSSFASGTAALTVGAVANVQADDLILLFVESANQAVTTPSGWTQVTGSPVSTGTAAAAGGVRLTVFYQFATGADTTDSVADSGDHTTAIKLAFRGVDLTTPFDATPVSAIKTPASTSSSFPGITTATANAWIVHASALDLDSASTATTGTPTNANLIELTERHDQTVTSGQGGGLVIITGEKSTAGATGNTTATVTSTIQVYLTMALREAPLPTRTGDLDATETGSDTFSGSGDVFIEGALSANEAGSDTFAATGSVSDPANTGSMAASETGLDTLASTGKVIVRGSLAGTEAGQDAFTASGDVFVKGALSATESGSDTLASSGKVLVKGAVAGTESGNDTFLAVGGAIALGTLSATETGSDTFAATGEVITANPPITGSMGAVESADTVGGYVDPGYLDPNYVLGGWSGRVLVQGSLSASESGQDGFEASSFEPTPPSGRAGFEMGGRKVYIKRGKRIHIFDTVEDADAWVEAEEQAQQAIQTAKGKKKVKAKAKVYKALDEQVPHEVIRLDWLESLIAHFNIPVELPTLEARQDWLEVARIALMAQQMQDDEEVELLLLA